MHKNTTNILLPTVCLLLAALRVSAIYIIYSHKSHAVVSHPALDE